MKPLITIKEKTDGTRSYWLSRVTFCVSFFTAVGLIVGGFFVPPCGVIDGSILKAVGLLLLWPSIVYAFRAIELGINVKFKKGDASVEFNNDKNN